MRKRAILGLFLVIGVLAAPLDHASSVGISDGTGPLDTDDDLQAALAYEAQLDDNLIYGQPHNLIYNTSERIQGDVAYSVHEGDAGLYTGSLLAGESYRYALARKELAKNPTGEVFGFWTAQAAQAKARIDMLVAKYHLLVNISKNWTTEFDPSLHPEKDPLEKGFIEYGGGIIPAEAGLLMRVCHPTDAPAKFNIAQHFAASEVYTMPWDDGKSYDCLNATSRDAYAGATYGLTTALNMIGPYDKQLRKQVAADIMAMSDYAIKYLFNQPRPHGHMVIPAVGGNDLQGPFSPLFIYTPYARMNMVQVARNAARTVGDTLKLARYNVLWEEELATQLPQLQASMTIDASGPHESYYKFHLNHLTGDDIIRLEPNAQIANLLRASFGVMDATTGDDDNALFEIITYSLTGDRDRLSRAVQHHREYLDYRANADALGNVIDYRGECGTTIECVPTTQVDIVQPLPNGEELVVPQPGADLAGDGDVGVQRATTPRPVGLRRPADFLWQKDPTIIVGCGGGVVPNCDPSFSSKWESPAVDFIQTYWMIRYFSEVRKLPRTPFPKWTGPRFR